MAELRPLLINILLFSLVAIGLLTGGILLATTNNATQSIGDEPVIADYVASLNETLRTTGSDAQASQDAIGDSPVSLTTGFPVFDAIFGIWKTLKEVPVTIYNLTIGLLVSKVMSSTAYFVVSSVIAAILIITIILAVWKLVATGEGG